jgi:hypothetical protein
MGLGGSPSRNWNELPNALLLRVSALWIGNAVSQMDEALDAQLRRRAFVAVTIDKGVDKKQKEV